MMKLPNIDSTWTLFLDRDGVINVNNDHGYILSESDFKIYPASVEALKILRKKFSIMVVVTNQRCIAKGLLTVEGLEKINRYMDRQIGPEGKIDRLYYSPDLEDDAFNRKPNIGMALMAQKDFPQIDFKKSIMVGNKLSDMKFGRNAGMFTVFVETTNPEIENPHPAIDARFATLLDFTKNL